MQKTQKRYFISLLQYLAATYFIFISFYLVPLVFINLYLGDPVKEASHKSYSCELTRERLVEDEFRRHKVFTQGEPISAVFASSITADRGRAWRFIDLETRRPKARLALPGKIRAPPKA